MNLENFKIFKAETIKNAFLKMEKNNLGVILIVEGNDTVLAIATDGDIRRYLIQNNNIEDAIINCANFDFKWVNKSTTRENLIKKLDQKIRVIPILDDNKKLFSMITKDNLPKIQENDIYVRSKSPVRISFGGGGSDLTTYFTKMNGAVINATVSIYSHATLKVRSDKKVIINSLDLKSSIECDNLTAFFKEDKKFGLIQAVIKTIMPKIGFELHLYSDYPMSSGLGGSAVVVATILGCFNELRTDKWNQYELSELAYQAERLCLDIAGGWQDQYATTFGGFNFIEFSNGSNIVHPLKFNSQTLLELEESLILCDTKTTHQSDVIHKNFQTKIFNKNIKNLINANVELCYEIRNSLLKGNLFKFGLLLDQAWQYKKKFSNNITNDSLDLIYINAKKNGATGGKLLGAGGGGFFLFFVNPFKKLQLISFLKNEGLNVMPFNFDQTGLQSWIVRKNKL